MKKIYFFIHIPKTAGTSFRLTLQENDSVNMLYDYGEESSESNPGLMKIESKTLTPDNDLFLAEKINMICGHITHGKYAHCVAPDSIISIIRNPIERLVSEYQHLKRHAGLTACFTDFSSRKFQQNKQWRMLQGLDTKQNALIGLTSHYKYFVEMFSSKLELPMKIITINKAPASDTEDRLNISSSEIRSAYQYNKKDVDFFFRQTAIFIKNIRRKGYNTIPPKNTKWNCRIDEGRRIVGWLSCRVKDCFFIVIKVNSARRVVIALDQHRIDLVEKGLSENPTCGFNYPLSLLGAEPNDEISIGILGAPGFYKILRIDSWN